MVLSGSASVCKHPLPFASLMPHYSKPDGHVKSELCSHYIFSVMSKCIPKLNQLQFTWWALKMACCLQPTHCGRTEVLKINQFFRRLCAVEVVMATYPSQPIGRRWWPLTGQPCAMWDGCHRGLSLHGMRPSSHWQCAWHLPMRCRLAELYGWVVVSVH